MGKVIPLLPGILRGECTQKEWERLIELFHEYMKEEYGIIIDPE